MVDKGKSYPRKIQGFGKCPNYFSFVSITTFKYLLEMKYPQDLGPLASKVIR